MEKRTSKNWWILIALALLGNLGCLLLMGKDASMQATTQPYVQSRYALLNGPVLGTSQNLAPVVQNALFRIDTVTGQVWVLQIQIQDVSNPQVLKALFIPTSIKTVLPRYRTAL